MILDRRGFGLWSFIASKAFRAVFEKPASSREVLDHICKTIKEDNIAVYIHIPFCTGTCLFCPYVRFPLARDEMGRVLSKYVEALLNEMKIYSKVIKELGLKVVDVHMGGGTPSILSGRHIKAIVESLAQEFGWGSGVAIEANPEDLRDESRAFELVDAGVREVSVGVQSFNPKTLRSLGRRHSVEDSLKSIENLHNAGCRYINVDLMYMVPGQTLREWMNDLEMASQQNVDEITCYPTLITPQSIGYKLIREGRLKQPSGNIFKEMVYACEDMLPSRGFKPVEIYGYSRLAEWKYATVNYEMVGPLMGLGAGAVGFTGGYEYANTCHPAEYMERLALGNLPVAVARKVDENERMIRYVTTQVFVCRRLYKREFRRKFDTDYEEFARRTHLGKALKILKMLRHLSEDDEKVELTRKGLFTAHKITWAFVTNVPCRMAEECLREPWPQKIVIP